MCGRYVTSDSDAIETAYASHHYVTTAAEAACGGVKDGQCDINSGNTYYENLYPQKRIFRLALRRLKTVATS